MHIVVSVYPPHIAVHLFDSASRRTILSALIEWQYLCRKKEKMKKVLFLLLFGLVTMFVRAQGYVEIGYTPTRDFMKDDEGDKLGSGNMWQFRGRYTFPFSAKQNEMGQPIVWSGTLSGMYARMDNEGMAKTINPDEVLNVGFNVSHLRPISEKWYMMASLGVGIYSAPSEISFKSVLANGAAIFAYKVRNNLDIGVGIGLTNSYGVPLIMPMGFLKWNLTGKYEVDVNVAGSMKASVLRKFSDKFRLRLVPIEMDGMSSVIKWDEEHKIYGATRMRAYLSPELKVGKNSFVYLGIGAELHHSVKVSDRSYKGFFNAFKGDNSWEFDRGFHLMGGFKYGF